MKKQHPIDKYFKDGLEEHKTQPSEAVWEKISSELESSQQKRGGGWYMMRAAVVVLLVGISSLLYFQNHEAELMIDGDPVAVEENNTTSANKNKAETTEAAAENPEKEKGGKKEREAEPVKKEPKKSRKAIPLVHPNTNAQPIMVSNEKSPAVVDEAELMDEVEMALTAQLDPSKTVSKKQPSLKVKMKLSPATARAFYADNQEQEKVQEEDQDIKEKVFAYATDQFDNLRSGKRLELPRAERKPQLEINLDKLF